MTDHSVAALCQLTAEYSRNRDAQIGSVRIVEGLSFLAKNLDLCLETRREREMFLDNLFLDEGSLPSKALSPQSGRQ